MSTAIIINKLTDDKNVTNLTNKITFIYKACIFLLMMYKNLWKKQINQDDLLPSTRESVYISEINQVQGYSNLNQIKLSREKAKKITDQLELEEQAKHSFNYRFYSNDFVLNYNHNPFVPNVERKRPDFKDQRWNKVRRLSKHQDQDQEPSAAKIDLMDAMMRFRDKDKPISRQVPSQLIFSIEKANKMSRWLNPILKFPQDQVQKVDDEQSQERVEKFFKQQQLSLDDILNMKDTNYYHQNQSVDNLFHVLFVPREQIVTGSNILDKHYFCNDSMKETARKNSVSIYRDISTFSRRIIRNMKVKEEKACILENRQQNIDNDIHTLLSIASGRSNSEDVNRMLLQGNIIIMKGDDSLYNDSIQVQNRIDKKKNNNHKATLFEGQRLSQNIAYEYIKQSLTPYEANAAKGLEQILSSVQQTIKQIHKVMKMNINDKKTIKALEEQKKAKIMDITKYNETSFRNKDQLIRMSKLAKGRGENLKIKAQTRAIIMDREHKKVVKQKISQNKHKRAKTSIGF